MSTAAGGVDTAIRAARAEDLPALGQIERAAGASFRTLGMHAVADDPSLSVASLATFQEDGRAWVAADEAGRPVAYLLVDVVDATAYVEQVSVHPDHARQGLGRTLLETAEAWATACRLAALTLTAFAEVPWNAPYYERLGFRVVPMGELTRGLRRIREHEAARGLDRWPRVSMRRPVALGEGMSLL